MKQEGLHINYSERFSKWWIEVAHPEHGLVPVGFFYEEDGEKYAVVSQFDNMEEVLEQLRNWKKQKPIHVIEIKEIPAEYLGEG